MRSFKNILLAFAILYLPLQTMAWGTEGHRVSGQIADNYLTPKARRAIRAILGNESIAMASTWADFIKSDPAYNYLSVWHYVDFDRQYTYPEMKEYLLKDTAIDAYTKLNFLMAQLKNRSLLRKAKLYLRMLIHIVEDVHQPMHTAHADDEGGNKVKVTWNKNETNLHSIWDSQLIDFQQLSYTEYTAWINFTTAAQRKAWQKAPLSQWLFESSQLSDKIYAETKNGYTLSSYKYNFKYIAIVNQQLLKGGVRLAGLLNQLFG